MSMKTDIQAIIKWLRQKECDQGSYILFEHSPEVWFAIDCPNTKANPKPTFAVTGYQRGYSSFEDAVKALARHILAEYPSTARKIIEGAR